MIGSSMSGRRGGARPMAIVVLAATALAWAPGRPLAAAPNAGAAATAASAAPAANAIEPPPATSSAVPAKAPAPAAAPTVDLAAEQAALPQLANQAVIVSNDSRLA